jgi:hypothetical protein
MAATDMDLNRSLMFVRFVLRAVYEGNIKPKSKLSNFLAESNFFNSVFSTIFTVNDQLLNSVKKDLADFLEKAEEFRNREAEFTQYWPYAGGEKIFLAFQNIMAKKAGDGELFTVIVGTVREVINIIGYYEGFNDFKDLYLARCGI